MRKSIWSLIIFLSLFPFFSLAYSKEIIVNDIKLYGNKNISKETIFSNAGIKSNNFLTSLENLNLIKKKLFETNFFSKVDLKISNNILIIEIEENPLVELVIFSGLDERKDFISDLEKSLSLKSNLLFSEFLLNSDVLFIRDYLKNQGYINNKISYRVNLVENNRVNIFFDIQLNKKFFTKNIIFIGDKKFSSSKLSSIITSSEDSYLNFLSSSSIPSIDRVNFDAIKLKNFYLSEGFYDVQISNSSINVVDDNYVEIVFSINAGAKYNVVDYIITGDTSFLNNNDIAYINSQIKKNINQVYNQFKIDKLKNLVFDYISAKGFSVDVYHIVKRKSNSELTLDLRLNEVKQKKIINNVKVLGNDITEEKVIRNNILFSEGDIFKELLINKSKNKLLSLNIFKDIIINYKYVDKSDLVDIEISLKEMPTGEISSGVGIGTSGSTIAFNLKENNFLGQAIKTNIGLSLGTQRVLGNIYVSNPDFLDTGNTFNNNLYITKTTYNSAGYENKIIGNDISYAYNFFQDTEFLAGFGINMDKINVNDAASALIRTQEGNYFTTRIFYNIFNDKRDRQFKPTSGYTIGFGQDFAFSPSDIPYIKNNFYGSFFRELSDDFTGSVRYKINTINSLNNNSLKLSDRLFLTDNELRGFSYRGLGPKVENDFIGGNYSFLTSLSTTFPNGLPNSWKASSNMFFDIGNVWGADISGVHKSNKLRSSLGLGFTWGSPIGPISITYAEPITKDKNDNVENFNFKIGGVF